MNKLFALVAICGLALSLAACPDKPANNDKPSTTGKAAGTAGTAKK